MSTTKDTAKSTPQSDANKAIIASAVNTLVSIALVIQGILLYQTTSTLTLYGLNPDYAAPVALIVLGSAMTLFCLGYLISLIRKQLSESPT